ncbi:MAG TPA: hypothetical protein VFT87_03775 [Candidatus Saccharimonadales bacterium]|nr:hypothetical protein [Candidatus Saccharimonadales bacterium]
MLKLFIVLDGDRWVEPLLKVGMSTALAEAYEVGGLTGLVPQCTAIGCAYLVHDETRLSVDVIPNFAAILELGDCDLARIATPFLQAWMSHILPWCQQNNLSTAQQANIQLFVTGKSKRKKTIAGVGAYIATREIFGAWNCDLVVGSHL